MPAMEDCTKWNLSINFHNNWSFEVAKKIFFFISEGGSPK